MMHGREKSDFGIVAMKSANKFAQADAESVERRPVAKENANQSNKHRTQSRERLSQRLDQCTRESKKAIKQNGLRRYCTTLHRKFLRWHFRG